MISAFVPDVPARRRTAGRVAAVGAALGNEPASGLATAFATGFCAGAAAAGLTALLADALLSLAALLSCARVEGAEGIEILIVVCRARLQIALPR